MTAQIDFSKERHEINFYLRRCIKYHSYRSKFFGQIKNFTSMTTVLFGSGVAATLIANAPHRYAAAASIIVTIFSAFELIIGTARKSWDHNDLKKRFYAVESELIAIHPDKLSQQALLDIQIKIRKIEADEPYGMKLLNAIAENDVIWSMYPSEDAEKLVMRICWFQRLTANIIDWDVCPRND